MGSRGPFDFVVEEDEVVEAMRRHMIRRMTTGLIGKMFIAVVVLLALLIVLDIVYYGRLGQVALAIVIALPVALAIINLWLVPNMGRRQYRQSVALRARTTIGWDDEAITFTAERGSARVPFAELYRWDETERLILLYQTELFFNFVPRAALGVSADDLVEKLQAAGVRRN